MRRVGMNGGARSHAPRHLARCARPRATAVPLANPRRCRPSFQARGLSACAGVSGGGMHSMLRLALLCHLSVAGAVRLANNVECLPSEANEVFLDLSGARATAFPKGISQLTARLWRTDSELLHNNLGNQGGRDAYITDSKVPGCEGRTQGDVCSQAMGALAPAPRPRRGQPHRAPALACAQSLETSSTRGQSRT